MLTGECHRYSLLASGALGVHKAKLEPAALLIALGCVRAAAELAKLHTYLGDVTVLSADAKVQQVVPAAQLPAFLQKGSWRGGGGTNHRPVFEWLAKQQVSPDLFIGITDLQTLLPTQRPHFPVLWLVPEKHPKPPWGQVLVMSEV